MDTQGTADNGSTYQMSNIVFALSTLLSSVQIYNLVETIQEESLAHLSLFVEYGRLVLDEAAQFGPPFQVFINLICH